MDTFFFRVPKMIHNVQMKKVSIFLKGDQKKAWWVTNLRLGDSIGKGL